MNVTSDVSERTIGREPEEDRPDVVLVTGPSGAGRTTSVHALEDLGFETIDNLPLSLVPRILSGAKIDRPLALGIDVRNRDFSIDTFIQLIDELTADPNVSMRLLFLDCAEDELIKRYAETRRKHPLLPDQAPIVGIAQEKALLVPIRNKADFLIETTGLTPHDLRNELGRSFASESDKAMVLSVQSFSYRRGIPRGVDYVFDCRFLRNPHWDQTLRALDGRDTSVADYVREDDAFAPFLSSILSMVELVLPAFRESGKSHLAIAFGCTGGQHRSVALTEILANALAEKGLQVSKRHREMERRDAEAPALRGSNS